MSPLTQGLNYRSACDAVFSTVFSPVLWFVGWATESLVPANTMTSTILRSIQPCCSQADSSYFVQRNFQMSL